MNKMPCPACGSLNVVRRRGRVCSYWCKECRTRIYEGKEMTINNGLYVRKGKRDFGSVTLERNQYWDTVLLKGGGSIRVIKLRGKFYPEGH